MDTSLQRAIRQISVAAEASAAGGLLLALAAPRLVMAYVPIGLSARLGFNIGWVYLALGFLCVVAASMYYRLVVTQAARRGLTLRQGAFLRGLAMMFATAVAVGFLISAALKMLLPTAIKHMQAMGIVGSVPTLLFSLLPLVLLLVVFRLFVPGWARGIVSGPAHPPSP